MEFQNYIYSKTQDYFLVMPMKSGSVTCSWIFTYFDFFTYTRTFRPNNKVREFKNPSLNMVHSYYIPEEVIEPKIIMTARNPYDRVLSRFLFTWTNSELPKPEDFTSHIVKSFEVQNPMYMMPDNIKPKYIIHLENLREDYLKIPFIYDSNLFKCGILDDVIQKKMNETLIKVNKSEFLNESNKELIYNFMKNQFEPLGYEK